jgi:restriction system protein
VLYKVILSSDIYYHFEIFKRSLSATIKKGVVPIILIDGMMIIDIMIEKKFGIEIAEIPLYINALDIVLED